VSILDDFKNNCVDHCQNSANETEFVALWSNTSHIIQLNTVMIGMLFKNVKHGLIICIGFCII